MAVVALIDADPLQARLIIDNLRSLDHHVVWAQQSWDGLLLIHHIRPDLLIIDCAVPQWAELLTLARSLPGLRATPRMLIATPCPSPYYLQKFGIVSCLDRYFDAADLVQHVQQVLRSPPHVSYKDDQSDGVAASNAPDAPLREQQAS